MARTNIKKTAAPKYNNEGTRADPGMKPIEALRRSVFSCFLWEDSFYEDGQAIAQRIKDLSEKVTPKQLADVAVEARTVHHMRHVPLLLLAVLCKRGSGSSLVSDTIVKVIQRADELAEFVAVYAEVNGVTPDKVKPVLSAQAKKGLARAFGKFDEYAFSKYNRDGAVSLRDVMFLCHPSAKSITNAKERKAREALYKRIADQEMKPADTWEVALSAGDDKKETFTRLLKEGQLGYFALLRNLRNMNEAGVDRKLIKDALLNPEKYNVTGKDRILPFRFVSAARVVPQFEDVLDEAMLGNIAKLPSLPGTTVVLVDISPSMDVALSAPKAHSAYSKRPAVDPLKRVDAACALASIVNAEDLRVFSFANDIVEVPPRRGMAGIDAIRKSQRSNGTLLGKAMTWLNANVQYDRVIVITDEESQDKVGGPREGAIGYMLNVQVTQNSVAYAKDWTRISGFSENVLRFIHEIEGIQD